MTSTFTTNKTLELPANGDYVNTWNIPVNSDMTVIDTALGGTTNLNATSGSATLTYTQYRPLILSVTGAVSANVTYTIPSGVGGQWIVRNAMTDSSGGPWDLIFASGGGGTSVIVSRGFTTTIYSDGTNISYSDSRLSTAAGSNRQIQYNNNGVLGASSTFVYDASGNVGIGTASPAYKLDVQGGRAVVSPASEAFAVGLRYNASTDGVWLGSPSANALQISSFSGTPYLNITSSGNVGIGTASPNTKLEVRSSALADSIRWTDNTNSTAFLGTIAAASTIYTNTSLAFGTGSATFSEKMRIDSSGNVGIGTASPTNKLTVNGNINANNYYIINSGTTDAGVLGFSNSNGPALQMWGSATASSGAMIFTTAGTEAMRITSAWNVGIGTSSPGAKFQVIGSTTISSQVNVAAVIGSSVTSDLLLGSVNGNTPFVASQGAYPLSFRTNANERMRIDSSGNVTVGTTNAGNTLRYLDVQNTDTGSSAGSIMRLITSNAAASGNTTVDIVKYKTGGFYINNNETDAAAFTAFNVGASERMRIDSSGNLNIGSSSNITGNSRLSVVNTNSAEWVLALQVGNTTNGVLITNVSGTAGYSAMIFYNNGTSYSTCGSISVTGSSTSFNTSSDYRMKENINTLTTGLATIGALNPVTYDWIGTQEKGEGFIAHELAEIIPLAVTGEKDAVDKNGKMKPQGVDYSKVVVHLVAAIQELSAKVAALEGK
jgi:hypothetical protein